jgi:GNAT superfamily N-acetyltransferase
MAFKIVKTELKEILFLRNLFLQENNFQIRYNACHERGWTDSYLITHNDVKIGYGSVKGKDNLGDRDAIFEFYLIPSFRDKSSIAFVELLRVSGAGFIECQTNDGFLTSLIYQHAQNIYSDTILFLDDEKKAVLNPDKVIFRKKKETDVIFEHHAEPEGDFVLEFNGEIVATGGFLLHYNFPFADLYMEVAEKHRKKGFGSFLIQETIKACYLAGRAPAARCGMTNTASKMTLLKGGFKIAGFMLTGTVAK